MGDQIYGNQIGWNVNKYWKWVDLRSSPSFEGRSTSVLARTNNIDRKPNAMGVGATLTVTWRVSYCTPGFGTICANYCCRKLTVP